MALIVPLVGGAYVMALATASHEHTWLGWLTLLPLLVAIRVCRPPCAAASGAVWGLSFCAFSFLLAGRSLGYSIGSLLLLTLVPAVYACLGAWLTRLIGFSPLVLGVGWMGVELAFEPLGLRNGLLAGAQGDGTLILWIARAFGYVVAAFLVAYVSASFLSALGAVRVTLPRPYTKVGRGEDDPRILPQTFTCFPLFAIHPSRPRAPPCGAECPAQGVAGLIRPTQ